MSVSKNVLVLPTEKTGLITTEVGAAVANHISFTEETDEDTGTNVRFVGPACHTKAVQQEQPLQHLGLTRQYWRDIILGVNDGLISTFLLVTGVAGGGLTSKSILLTAIAGAIAGAVSMSAGEYVATKSQNEVMAGELELEKEHICSFRHEEMQELATLLNLIGITDEEMGIREQLYRYYNTHPDALLQIMKTLEFGVVEEEIRSPITAGMFSGFLFIGGSIPSIVPFIISKDDPIFGMFLAAIFTTLALLIVGGIKTWASRGNCLSSALENLMIAGMGGLLSYFVGIFFDSIIV